MNISANHVTAAQLLGAQISVMTEAASNLILQTPTSEARNRLTEANIRLIEAGEAVDAAIREMNFGLRNK